MYDWANSAFATTVMAGFFPLFFKQYWSVEVAATTSSFWLGLANTLASLVIMLASPLLGAMADFPGDASQARVGGHGQRGALAKRLDHHPALADQLVLVAAHVDDRLGNPLALLEGLGAFHVQQLGAELLGQVHHVLRRLDLLFPNSDVGIDPLGAEFLDEQVVIDLPGYLPGGDSEASAFHGFTDCAKRLSANEPFDILPDRLTCAAARKGAA